MLVDQLIKRLNTAPKKIILSFAPRLDQLPPQFQPYDEPFFPYGKSVLVATSGLVSGYLFDFPAYLATGAAGIIALERTLAYAAAVNEVVMLDGMFASADYRVAFTHGELVVDAVTVSDNELIDAFIDVGIAPILKSKFASLDCFELTDGQLGLNDMRWPIVNVYSVTNGSFDFEKTLRNYVLGIAD